MHVCMQQSLHHVAFSQCDWMIQTLELVMSSSWAACTMVQTHCPTKLGCFLGQDKKKKSKKDKKSKKGPKKETKEKKEKRLKKEQDKLTKLKEREEQKEKKDLFNKAKKAGSFSGSFGSMTQISFWRKEARWSLNESILNTTILQMNIWLW